jgi:hypothetical protein
MDNKNQHLLGFLSLLTVREVFEEVQLRFLMVGHTHEDMMKALDICPRN